MSSGVEGEIRRQDVEIARRRPLGGCTWPRENVVFRKMCGLSKWPLHSIPKEGNDLWGKKFDLLQGKND